MSRGGKREGAGRKPGSGNKYKIEASAAAKGISPLDYMLKVMRSRKATEELRMAAAKAAAPYVHRALKAMEISGPEGGPIEQRVVLSFD